MNVQFTNPITIGDLQNRITVSGMQVKAVSFNLAPATGAPNVRVSTTLTDPVSGYDAHFVYEDSTTTATFWQSVSQLQCVGDTCCWISKLLERLMTDGKLPQGTISASATA